MIKEKTLLPLPVMLVIQQSTKKRANSVVPLRHDCVELLKNRCHERVQKENELHPAREKKKDIKLYDNASTRRTIGTRDTRPDKKTHAYWQRQCNALTKRGGQTGQNHGAGCKRGTHFCRVSFTLPKEVVRAYDYGKEGVFMNTVRVTKPASTSFKTQGTQL